MKSPTTRHSPAQTSRGRSGRDYLPLAALLAVSVLTASARSGVTAGSDDGGTRWMHDFMGFFLVVFALLKVFNLSGFADGFQKYDLLARRFRAYALAYPFIELALGLGYLAFWRPATVYAATVIILGFTVFQFRVAERRVHYG
jgi:hypothetical protein